jgi:hypothetical protein
MGAFVLAMACPGMALAEGAVAVGLPRDVAKQGLAFGVSWGYADENGASARALQECRSFKGVPDSTLKLCKVIQTFKGECAAFALDPEPNTPGVGWAVAPTEELAQSSAMERCKRTAGAGREQFCKVSQTRCDGK